MTPKQQRFVDEYLIDLNATQAAIRAGYSARTAEQQGYQLLQNPSVSAAIAEQMEERSRDTAIDAAWVLREAQSVYQAARKEDRLPIALRALELMGKHIDVQAFRDQIEHRHAMTLEDADNIIRSLGPKLLPKLLARDAETGKMLS